MCSMEPHESPFDGPQSQQRREECTSSELDATGSDKHRKEEDEISTGPGMKGAENATESSKAEKEDTESTRSTIVSR